MIPLSSVQNLTAGFNSMPMPAVSRPIPGAELEKLGPAAELPKLNLSGPSSAPSSSAPFSSVLEQMVDAVNNKQAAAAQAVHDLQSGRSASLHQTMIAMEEASVSFQLMVEVRNKVLESYQELMRMQV